MVWVNNFWPKWGIFELKYNFLLDVYFQNKNKEKTKKYIHIRTKKYETRWGSTSPLSWRWRDGFGKFHLSSIYWYKFLGHIQHLTSLISVSKLFVRAMEQYSASKDGNLVAPLPPQADRDRYCVFFLTVLFPFFFFSSFCNLGIVVLLGDLV